ncbi:MAG: hypothetical protein GX974_08010 [Clostridiales bacterium]|nr:hypothetical protein [Clostridiales bacterium]
MKTVLKMTLTNLIGLSLLNIIINMILSDGDFKRYAKFMLKLVMMAVILKMFLNINDRRLLDESLSNAGYTKDMIDMKVDSETIKKTQDIQVGKIFKRELEAQMKAQISNIASGDDVAVLVELESIEDGRYEIKAVDISLKDTGTKAELLNIQLTDREATIEQVRQGISDFYNIPKNIIRITTYY